MRIPYVIDNIEHTLAEVLNYLLSQEDGPRLDVATAYFSIRGFQQLRHTLPGVRGLRLLLGDEPEGGDDVGVRPDSAAYLRHELNAAPLQEDTARLVEELVRFLRREDVKVRLYMGRNPEERGRRRFLHAKCYLLWEGMEERGGLQPEETAATLYPLVAIVGSSNFTGPGLTSNRELNLVHKTILSEDEVDDAEAREKVARRLKESTPIKADRTEQRVLKSEVGDRAISEVAQWYEAQWAQAIDYKEQLVEVLENSKFGGREYTPYEIYMKALYEYFRDDLDTDMEHPTTRSAVELTEFQEDAVKKARRILARYDGVLVADSVGLGKTWIGKKLLEDYAYHQRQKALVICPASLREMWREELQTASIAARVISQERLGQGAVELHGLHDVDVILVDEAHNFRNRRTNRYEMVETILAANGRRGRSGGRKKVILLTATPINNTIFDLYNQINLFAGNDRTYFAAAGIGDLYKYFLAARRESIEEGSIRVFNLLEEVVVRRTRQFIRRAYPEATIGGKRILWPDRQLRTVRYDLEATYEGFYRQIVRRIESLNLAHYYLESYKLAEEARDDFELGRQQALVGIFKSRFLKRLESSIDAFRISVSRALQFVQTFAEYVQDDVILDAASFHLALRLLEQDASDDEVGGADGAPGSLAGDFDEDLAVRELIDVLPRLDPEKYDRRRLYRDLKEDIEALSAIWRDIKNIGFAEDAKLEELKTLLRTTLAGEKVIVFTYYKDTARYLERALMGAESEAWREALGQPNLRRIDSDTGPPARKRVVERFAPRAHNRPDLMGAEEEIDVLIATDVLSEGQNLQDAGFLVNYDLHWNPTRMVQRAGRIDRLGSPFDVLTIYNMFPERELEALLGLVERLTSKIDVINQTGFLDASVLGEVVTPRDFNTIRRIAEEDSSVVEEQESFLELASSEGMMAELQKVLATEAARWLTDLDDGIHSGLQRAGQKGVFFYFTASQPPERGMGSAATDRQSVSTAGGRTHFWRYYDLHRRAIVDNRYQIMQIIACGPETPRYPPPYDEWDIYEIQEKVMQHILGDVAQQEMAAAVDKPVAEEQNIVRQILRNHANSPGVDRREVLALSAFLRQPLVGAAVKALREAVQVYSTGGDVAPLLETLRELHTQQGQSPPGPNGAGPRRPIVREDLHLVCFEYIT